VIATQRRCPPLRAAGIGTSSNHWRDNSSPSPLEQAKSIITIFDLWRHFGFPGNPERQNPVRSPFRPDKRASFSITSDGHLFNDFATGDTGDMVTFWRLATGLSVADACKSFIEYAGTGRSSITPITRITSPASPAERQKPSLPPMQRGDHKRLKVLASFRKLSPEGLQLADERGLLHFALLKNLSTWIVTDSERVNAQARRMDGGLWQHLSEPAKAYTLPGCWAAWPIGIREAQDFPVIALCEGAPDLLAAHHFIYAEERERDVAAVCITGATMNIHETALPHFTGKRVRIYPHLDDAGGKAAERWTAQLESVNATVDCYDLSGIPIVSGGRVGDLNDISSMDADTFESDRELWSVLP
jgi:hypothetical protein